MGINMSCQKRFLALLFVLALPMLLWAADAKPVKTWMDRIKISGDFRYRHELISEEVGTSAVKVRVPDRNRHRIRLRLGVQGQVNDDIDVIARFATAMLRSGSADPTSTNQDLGGGFAQKSFWLERAYIDYHPFRELTARAGKLPVQIDGTELVWASDLNLEGIAALPSYAIPNCEFYMGLGGYWASERKSSDGPDQGLFMGQIGATPTFGKVNILAAVSYIDYGNVKNGPTIFDPAKGAGNSVYTTDGKTYYKNDFNLINATGSVTFKTTPIDFTVLGDFVQNTGADKDTANTGWLVGLALKFRKLPLDWDLSYNYRDLEADATLGANTDPLPGAGGTNINGHKITLYATIMAGTRVGFTYFRNLKDPDYAKLNYNRLMIDIETKF
jgi:hypothetical protein